MKRFNIVFAGCIAVIVSGCNNAVFVAGVPGSGVMTTEDREIDDFSAISFSGAGKLNIVCGESTSLTLTTDDNLVEIIESAVEDDTLRIWSTENISPTETPQYEISTESLSRVSISGSSNVDVSNYDGEDFDFHVSGSGKVKVVGKTDRVSIHISGSGRADLSELEAKDVSINVSGSGRANVIARNKLDVSISGSGRIQYVGSPEINQSISGSGRISKTRSKKAQKKADENNDQRANSTDEDDVEEEDEAEIDE